MTFKVYAPDELSNEDYHSDTEYVSGSALCKIYLDSPAAWRFGDHETTPALEFGIASHAALLEPEKFDAEFVRGLDKSDHPDALTSDTAIKSWLKEKGVKGYSNKSGDELLALVDMTGESVQIWSRLLEEFEQDEDGKVIIKPADYDKIMQMRAVVFADEVYARRLSTGFAEYSILGELDGVKVKIRPDIMTEHGEIWDYKTTASAKPEKFGKSAYDYGYLLKMALQHDVFAAAYGKPPSGVTLLAQEKKPPYIAQAYELTTEQLAIGRQQYKSALQLYKRCRELDSWPAYGGGMMTLQLPEFIYKKHQGE